MSARSHTLYVTGFHSPEVRSTLLIPISVDDTSGYSTGDNLRYKEMRQGYERDKNKKQKMDKSIFEACLEQVDQGSKFFINFEERSLKIDGKYIIKNGKYEGRLVDLEEMFDCIENALHNIEWYYKNYKHSVPSQRSEAKHRTYFKALPELKLTQEDMMYGGPRETAQYVLEMAVLMAILLGAFTEWDDAEHGKWFWQSQKDKDLVILKQWVC